MPYAQSLRACLSHIGITVLFSSLFWFSFRAYSADVFDLASPPKKTPQLFETPFFRGIGQAFSFNFL